MIVPKNKRWSYGNILNVDIKMQETVFLRHWVTYTVVMLILVIISYTTIDLPLAIFFHSSRYQAHEFYSFLTDIIDPRNNVFFWPFVLFFAILGKNLIMKNRLLLFVLAIPFVTIVSEILKAFFGRARPELFFLFGDYGLSFFSIYDPLNSFPSGHATSCGALVGAVSCIYPRYSYLFLLLGFLLAFTRIILEKHFLSDILAGLVLGILLTQWIYTILVSRKYAFAPKLNSSK